MKRVTVIVLDSLGIGELPDAAKFNDEGANTLNHIVEACNGLNIPHLTSFGMGKIEGVKGIETPDKTVAHYGKMAEKSNGKDTTTGHWEMMGLYIEKPFLTFPNGFPDAFIKSFEEKVGRKTIVNLPASGTEVIEDYGEHHEKTGDLIVYTSADSVFQIAAHEDVVPIEELYSICQTARDMLVDDLQVARVIARPFVGKKGSYERTANRRDFSISPYENTVMDNVKEAGLEVYAIGKIEDIFNNKGVTFAVHNESNMDGVDHTIDALKKEFDGFIFTNLVDFDAKYGHRRDPKGYGKAIEDFDSRMPEIIEAMKEDDILILTADHGNDPVHFGTDHTREYVPLLVFSKKIKEGKAIGTRSCFGDIGATISEILGTTMPKHGDSFKELI